MAEARKFLARYPGRCPACLEPIDIGDDLVMEDESAVHFDCAGDRPRVTSLRPLEVCPRCFIEKAANDTCGCEGDE